MSASKDWRIRVQDIIEHAAYIEQMTKGMTYDDFAANLTVQFATARCIEIMGEATRHIPRDVQARCPDVAWRLMNDM